MIFGSYACPKCGSSKVWRERRNIWMRLIPGSRHLRCTDCGRLFVALNWATQFRFYL